MPFLATLVASVVVAAASPSPAPCPSGAPSGAASPVPCPSASPSPALTEIGRVNAPGRGTILLGKTTTASQGTIGQEQIATRPIARPGEVLEAIPGLIITQHSGEGKANQYYLRGFQLDHGTDLSATVAGQPINFPTHAHGQGYSDVNWLLPELVSFVEFKKGPYFADEGDFSTAGSYELFYRNTIPNTLELSGGTHGFGRILLAGSPKLGKGNLLYAFEAFHDDGTFDRPDNYRKLNGVVRYSRSGAERRRQRDADGIRRALELHRPNPAALHHGRRRRPLRARRSVRRRQHVPLCALDADRASRGQRDDPVQRVRDPLFARPLLQLHVRARRRDRLL